MFETELEDVFVVRQVFSSTGGVRSTLILDYVGVEVPDA